MPPRFALGADLYFSTALADYPASDGWVLTYRLVNKAVTGHVEFSAAASGADHLVDVPAATTAAWTAGTYTWASWVTKSGDVRNVATGETVLLPNPRTATGILDLRSEAQRALDAVRALLRGVATQAHKSYTIAGRSLERYSIGELLQLEQKLVRDVRDEMSALTGRRNTRRMVARVGRA